MPSSMAPWIVIGTAVFTALSLYLIDRAINAFTQRSERQTRESDNELLARHGMNAHLYMPAMGITDPALRMALERSASHNQIILDQQGQVVGKVLPRITRDATKPHLQLVVDNSHCSK